MAEPSHCRICAGLCRPGRVQPGLVRSPEGAPLCGDAQLAAGRLCVTGTLGWLYSSPRGPSSEWSDLFCASCGSWGREGHAGGASESTGPHCPQPRSHSPSPGWRRGDGQGCGSLRAGLCVSPTQGAIKVTPSTCWLEPKREPRCLMPGRELEGDEDTLLPAFHSLASTQRTQGPRLKGPAL